MRDTSNTSLSSSSASLQGIMKQRTLKESISSTRLRNGSTPGSSRPRVKRNISFDTVEIHQHGRVLDRPSKSSSSDHLPAALTISWKSFDTEVTTVQDYECTRPSRMSGPRKLNTRERVDRLVKAGHSLEDICSMIEEDCKIKRTGSQVDCKIKRTGSNEKGLKVKRTRSLGDCKIRRTRSHEDCKIKRTGSNEKDCKSKKTSGMADKIENLKPTAFMALMKRATKRVARAESASGALTLVSATA